MTYVIEGLPRARFAAYFAMTDAQLAGAGARRVIADADRGFPCRIAMDDAKAGERLILLNYVSHDVDGPYRTAYAIYVGEEGREPAAYIDRLPPYLANRQLSLRAFGRDHLAVTAQVVAAGGADGAIRDLFADPAVAYIMAHFAAYGCFAARIERHPARQGEGA